MSVSSQEIMSLHRLALFFLGTKETNKQVRSEELGKKNPKNRCTNNATKP